jgi:peptidoglycan/LPS O-acetylase OafA/YrhL
VSVHSPALDGVRGIAILLVLFHHFTLFDPVTTIGAWLGFVALLGWSGVDVFFVLSGFLITGILIDARGSNRYFASFYMRRVLRIFPLYYLIVFLSFVVLARSTYWHDLLVGPGRVAQWPYWTYLVNFAIAERGDFQHGVLDVAWSLAIEEQFYLRWHSTAARNRSTPMFCRICAQTRSRSAPCLRGSRAGNSSRPSRRSAPSP